MALTGKSALQAADDDGDQVTQGGGEDQQRKKDQNRIPLTPPHNCHPGIGQISDVRHIFCEAA